VLDLAVRDHAGRGRHAAGRKAPEQSRGRRGGDGSGQGGGRRGRDDERCRADGGSDGLWEKWWRRGVCEKGSVSRAAAWVDTQSDSMFGHAGSRPRQRGRETGGVAGCARRPFSGRTSPRLGLTRRRATRPPSVRVPQDRQGRPILPTPPPPSHRQSAGTVAWRVASGGAAGPRGPQRGQNGGDSRESEEAGAAGGRAAHGKRCVRVARPLLTGAETCGPVDRAAPTPLACVQRKGQAQARCRAGPPHEQTKTSCSSPFPHTLARRAPSRRAAARDAMVRRAGWVSKPGAAWSACERGRR